MNDLSRTLQDMTTRMAAMERTIQELSLIGRARPVLARYTTATAQSFTTGATTTINYGTLVLDADSHVTTPTTAWTWTTKVAGQYLALASVLMASTTNWALGEAGSLNLHKNGTITSSLDRFDSINSSVTGQFMRLKGCDVVDLAVGDTIDIRLRQDSGANLALHGDANFNYVAIVKIN